MGTEGDDPRAASFRRMAERVERNERSDFSGAVCIVPPDGETIELLYLRNAQDPGRFWGLVLNVAQDALAAIEEQQRQSWGRGR